MLNNQLAFLMKHPFRLILFVTVISSLLFSCGGSDDTLVPKPRAYYRIAFPEKKYVMYDSSCPFKFEIPVYATIEDDKNYRAEPCWLNLNFPRFNATLHLSYKVVNNNIDQYMEDTYTLASKHQIKASGIEEQLVVKDSDEVYGLIYEIKGNAASAYQFYLTDSIHHFVRGALYFNVAPNIDSIAPVLDFVEKDLQQLISSFKWKNTPLKTSSKPISAKAVDKK